MIICWNNIEKLKITRNGNFRIGTHTFYEYESCCRCGEPFLDSRKDGAMFCGSICNMNGRERTKITRFKISEATKGEKNPFYGKRHTEEAKQKNREAKSGEKNPFYGKKRPELSERMSGENHPNWKGGITCEPYCEVWTDKEYKHWITYERDGRCYGPECNGKHVHKLMPHHINYNKKNCGPMNLIALCRSCNAKANYDRKWHEAWYTEIMRRRFTFP